MGSAFAESGAMLRELCLPPPPPPSAPVPLLGLRYGLACVPRPSSQKPAQTRNKYSCAAALGGVCFAGPGSSVKNGHRLHAGGLPAQAQPPRTQARVALRRPLLRPDGRLAAAGARPRRCRVRTSHASQTLQFLRPRSYFSAPLTSEATLHRRGRAPPRRGTKVILTDLRKHDDLNGEVGFIVYKPDDRFDGAPVPRNPARPPGHRLRQGIKPARRHVRTLRRAPLHPRARRSVTLRSAPRAARAGASTTTRSSRSSTASSRSSD